VLAVEYFNASLGHYFLTVTPQEMALLDAGLPLPGWQRTGLSFWVFPADGSAPAGSNPVCRFYGRPEAGIDSHFYSASPQECQAVIDKFSWGWVLESPAYFYAFLPTNDGGCPDAAVSLTAIVRLYRTYNNRPDANHRFTTSQYIQGLMQYSQNWIPEGYGLYSVAMCLPY
jgi:serine protease